jgi:hypothetical protein
VHTFALLGEPSFPPQRLANSRVCASVMLSIIILAQVIKKTSILQSVHNSKGTSSLYTVMIINPLHACAARVTVLGPFVSVCLLPRFLPPHVKRQQKSDTDRFSATLA